MICYDKITGIHLELTTKCNAACPMCARNYRGRTRENLELVDLGLNECKKILTSDFLGQIEFISICGVLGDPVNNADLLEIIEYIYSCNEKIFINLYTNGSIHEEDWWKKLASIMKKGCVIFGIDGIDEVSSIYRRNTDVNIVFRNAKAYMAAGGIAKWDYIAFKHNEYQIEDARKLSKEMGFAHFQVKKTSRFFKSLYEMDSSLDSTILEYGKHPIFDNKENIVGYLELPDNGEYRNECENQLFEIIDKYDSIEAYFDFVEIECQSIKTRGIFISAKGEIFPCCTVYQQVCYGRFFNVNDESELNEFKIWEKDNTSALVHSIKEIVEGQAFQKLQQNWKVESIKAGKPKSCCRTCGKCLNMHLAQHKQEYRKDYEKDNEEIL